MVLRVAVKVQYPGVAKSIDSDIRNLMSLISDGLSRRSFIDNIAKHMKIELAQECDYTREGWVWRHYGQNTGTVSRVSCTCSTPGVLQYTGPPQPSLHHRFNN